MRCETGTSLVTSSSFSNISSVSRCGLGNGYPPPSGDGDDARRSLDIWHVGAAARPLINPLTVPASPARLRRRRSARSNQHADADDSERTLDRVQIAAWWRRDRRAQALRAIASECVTLRWSDGLLRLLLEELQIEDDFMSLLGEPSTIPVSHYPQAVAVAIVLRHSWRADSLEGIAGRIKGLDTGATPARRSGRTTGRRR